MASNQQSLDDNELKQNKLTQIIKFSTFCSVCCFLIGIFIPLIVYYAVYYVVGNQKKLQPQTYEEWGEIPGSTGTQVIRNFTFFNFSNPLQVLFLDQIPVFVQTGPYSYQQFQQYVNATYSTDGKIINFYDWVYFKPVLNTTGNEMVQGLNFGGIGAWYQMKSANNSMIFLDGFSTLVMNVANEVELVVATYGIQNMAFNNSAFEDLCLQSGVNRDQATALWNDPLFGMGNRMNLLWWVTIGKYRYLSGFATILQDYFQMDNEQFGYFLNFYVQWYQTIWLTSIKDNYCLDDSTPCDDLNIFTLQWTNQIITLYPPLPSIMPFPSITYTNNTITGYPEISYWKSQVFDQTNPNASKYTNITFPPSWAYQVTWYSKVPGEYNKNLSSLLNLGNLNFLFETGQLYDATFDTAYLQNIQQRFLLNTTDQAYVFWQYVKYFVDGFAVQNNLNGTVGIVSMANFVAPSLSQSFWNTYYYMMPTLEGNLIFRNLTSNLNLTNCFFFFSFQIQNISSQQTTKLCILPQFRHWDVGVIPTLTGICNDEFSIIRDYMIDVLGIQRDQILSMCSDQVPNSYGAVVLGADDFFFKFYNCSSQMGVGKCSKYQLTLRQWSSCLVTLNPPPMISDLFPPSGSIIEWNSNISAYPWEFYNVSSTLYKLGVYPQAPQNLTLNQSLMLLNYQGLFSETIIQTILICEKNNDFNYITQNFSFQYPLQLTTYIRYMLVYNVFGGFTQTRPINELLFGYTDPFLNYLKTMNPQEGGNPSYQSYLLINTPNSSYEQAGQYPMSLKTGISNPQVSNIYSSINNLNYINFNYSWFNGSDQFVQYVSPWANKVSIEGTNGFVNPSQLNKNSQVIAYNGAIYRLVALETNGHQSMKGIHNFDCYQFVIPKSFLANSTENPDNSIYYNDVFNGFVNLTSVYDAQLFVSQTHLLDADKYLQDNIVYMNGNGQIITANPADDSFMYIEPITGITFQAYVNAQINELIAPDDLFQINYTSMLPIANIFVSANLTQNAVQTLLGPLKSAMLFGYIVLGVGIGMGVVFFIVLVMTVISRKKLRSVMYISKKSGISENQSIVIESKEHLLEKSLNN